MDQLLAALEASWLARGLKTSFYVYPLVNAAHVASVGVVLTSVMIIHARAARFFARLDRVNVEQTFRTVALASFAVAALTGFALFAVNPAEYAANPVFRLKLMLLVAAGVNLGLYLTTPRWRIAGGILSALLWPAILIAGRFIGFV